MSMISAKTKVLAAVMLIAFVWLEYSGWRAGRPCREYVHRFGTRHSTAIDPPGTATFTPCDFHHESTWNDKLAAITFVVLLPVVLYRTSRDIYRGRRKQAPR